MHAEQHSVNSSWTHDVMAYKAGSTILTMRGQVCKLDSLGSNMLAGLQLPLQQACPDMRIKGSTLHAFVTWRQTTLRLRGSKRSYIME